MIDYREYGGKTVAVVSSRAISCAGDMLDIMAEVFFSGCDMMTIRKELLPDGFFSLKTGLAGEILQKFSNYSMRLAIVGDFSNIGSKSLADFIYECNKGKQVFFKNTEEEAIEVLLKASV